MLQLIPGSVCDVCAEEYGPHRPPHSIPCGHVFCETCCSKIIEKTLPRLTPVCPFCREHFARNDIRLIRFDYSNSGWPTPKRKPATIEALDMAGHLPAKHQEARFPLVEDSFTKPFSKPTKAALEAKVAMVAAKKCSVDEVRTLHQELTQWLGHDGKPEDQLSSLTLSAALLRAILINHFAHAEATRSAKSLEATLKSKLDQSENTVVSLDSELKKQQIVYTQKVQECHALRAELSRLSAKSYSSYSSSGSVPTRPTSAAPMARPTTAAPDRRSGATSPTSPPYSPVSPLSRSIAMPGHARSSSTSMSSSRPVTPAARTSTPGTGMRPETPATPSRLRPTSPTSPPPMPSFQSKARAMSLSQGAGSSSTQSSPQKIMRAHSDESDREGSSSHRHERWIPSITASHSPPSKGFAHASSYSSASPARTAHRSTTVSTHAA